MCVITESVFAVDEIAGEWRFDARRSASTSSTTHKSRPVYVGSTTTSTPDSNFWKRWATARERTAGINGFGRRLTWRWPRRHWCCGWRRRRDRQRDCCQRDGQQWGVSGSAARTSPRAGAMRPSAILRSVYSSPGTYIGSGCPICRADINMVLRLFWHFALISTSSHNLSCPWIMTLHISFFAWLQLRFNLWFQLRLCIQLFWSTLSSLDWSVFLSVHYTFILSISRSIDGVPAFSISVKFGPVFSSPAFPTPTIWSHVFHFCVFSVPKSTTRHWCRRDKGTLVREGVALRRKQRVTEWHIQGW